MRFENIILKARKNFHKTSPKQIRFLRGLSIGEFFRIAGGKKGFTLIELIIYTALLAIVLSVTVSLFFMSKTLESQIAQQQEIDRNARVALMEMTQTIRSAVSVSSPALGVSSADLYLNSSAIHYFANSNGIIQKSDSGQTYDETADTVQVSNLTFTTRGEAGKQPTVSIAFNIRTNTLVYGQTNYITKHFQTTVQLR